jgi:hypothetical protein
VPPIRDKPDHDAFRAPRFPVRAAVVRPSPAGLLATLRDLPAGGSVKRERPEVGLAVQALENFASVCGKAASCTAKAFNALPESGVSLWPSNR